MNFNEAINGVHACLTGRHDRNITRAVHGGMDDMLISLAASTYAGEMRDTATALMYEAAKVMPAYTWEKLKPIKCGLSTGYDFCGNRYYTNVLGYRGTFAGVVNISMDATYTDMASQHAASPHMTMFSGILGSLNEIGGVYNKSMYGVNCDDTHIFGDFNRVQKAKSMCLGYANERQPCVMPIIIDKITSVGRALMEPTTNGWNMTIGFQNGSPLNVGEVCMGYASRPYSPYIMSSVIVSQPKVSQEHAVAMIQKVGDYAQRIGQWDTIFDVGNGHMQDTSAYMINKGVTEMTYSSNALDIRRNNHIFGWLKDPNPLDDGRYLYKYVDITDVLNKLIAEHPDEFGLTNKMICQDVMDVTSDDRTFTAITADTEFKMYAVTYEAVYEASVVEGDVPSYRADAGIPQDNLYIGNYK